MILDISVDDIDTYSVKTEFPLGNKEITKDNPTGGQLDILLESKTHIIGIENKIYASDQDYQLTRYSNSLQDIFPNKKRYLLYLNPKGNLPPAEFEKAY